MKQILIVDDEPMIRSGLTKLVKQYDEGAEVLTASNGVDAIAAIHNHKPDLVLTDIRMPKMDGLELCKQIAAWNGTIRTVVISGYSDFSYAQKCLSYGVKEYLLKPLTEIELYPVLDRLLQQEDIQSIASSISAYEEWLEQVETALWAADMEALDRLIDQWKQDEQCGSLKPEQLQQAVAGGLKVLVKKLNARDLYRFAEPSLAKQPADLEEAVELLETELYLWCHQLVQWRGGNQKNVFEEAKSFIDQHITEDISLETVADKVGLAPTYFSYFFKKMTNETFVQYRMKKRIEMAKRLLEMPHYKIVDVGMEIGYQNYPHFSKIFKKMTGISPTEYRQLMGIK
jgi:two-component system response regulator YesN